MNSKELTDALDDAMKQLDRDELFKATIATVNALCLLKGVYTSDEFGAYMLESVRVRIKKAEKAAALKK